MMLKMNHIHKQIKDLTLFKIDNLLINQGEKIGLIGKNGSGKSTLLKMIAYIDSEFSGNLDNPFQTLYVPQLKKLSSESGGEQTKRYLLKAFNNNHELLLLDEPSTNLDQDNIKWLINEINQFKGTMIIVSHDRTLLNQTINKIVEIEDKYLNMYLGDYDDYEHQKKKNLEKQASDYKQYQTKIKQLEIEAEERMKRAKCFKKRKKNVSISDYKVNSRMGAYDSQEKAIAKSSKALIKRIEQIKKADKPKEEKSFKIKPIGKLENKGSTLINLDKFEICVNNKHLFKAKSFKVIQGDKIAINGPNGSGKTTYIKQLMYQNIEGYYKHDIKIGYFAQNLNTLDNNKSIFENVKLTSVQDDFTIRNLLAALGFEYNRIYQEVNTLSGGERVRLQIIKLLLGDYDMLILDEPTNFLDVSTLKALELFLIEYPGTFIIISHDYILIDNVASRKVDIKEHQLVNEIYQDKNQSFEDIEIQLLEFKLEQMIQNPDIDMEEVLALKHKINQINSRQNHNN
ncbi:ribosomal protection-like ABC-F family protein [Macrococcus animalis]|uniref:ribosomal protection-like ABC-F family protein n=1 Tax=Macrococcus animalis TaxID=3395467 RepID=UPI0039BE9675